MRRAIVILFLSNLAFGCTDVLDKGSLDEVTEQTYWTSAADLELNVNQFYPSLSGTINYFSLDEHSDNLQPLSPSGVLDGTRSVPESGGGWGWENIREINYFLENASQVTEGAQSDIDQYMGEGYFFRAYFYFQKVKRFGAVPWYDEALNIDSEELYAPREPRNIIVDHIIADLDRAIERLQGRSQVGANRVNLESALALKSRVALYEGTWEKY
ncbi:MAG TPA: RagB/SusD family nutrient uptake outer membrane protein, partial [Fodinibius sp.]|nr:RagB/SusD family nutrient uptake outer membrane protein [Fodinibius sp.]